MEPHRSTAFVLVGVLGFLVQLALLELLTAGLSLDHRVATAAAVEMALIAGNVIVTTLIASCTGAPLLLANVLAVGACTIPNFVALDRLVFRAAQGEA